LRRSSVKMRKYQRVRKLMKHLIGAVAILFALGTRTLAQEYGFATFDIASDPVLNDPRDLTIGPGGLLYVADMGNSEITVLDPDDLRVLGSFGDGRLFGVRDISFGPDGRAYVAVANLNRVDVFDVDGAQGSFVESIPDLPFTEGAYAHANGRLYAMASGIGVLVATQNNQLVAVAPGLRRAHDVTSGPDGTIWVADNGMRRLVQFDADLNFLQFLDGPEFGFVAPRYLHIDDFGRIVVSDRGAHRMLLIDPLAPVGSRLLGVIGDGLPGLGPGSFDNPDGVVSSGNSYFFSDSANNRIVKYTVIVN